MRRRLTETGGRQKEATSDSSRVVAGFKGITELGAKEWDWEMALTYSKNVSHEYGQNGFVQTSRIQQAIEQGRFNPLNTTQDQAVIDDITGPDHP